MSEHYLHCACGCSLCYQHRDLADAHFTIREVQDEDETYTMNDRRRLPRWQDEWSDGCSIPKPLHAMISVSPAARAACVRHDQAYYYGGSERDRLIADLAFLSDLLDTAKMPLDRALIWFCAVRAGGFPFLEIPRVSWSFGGDVFDYTDAPAIPDDAPNEAPLTREGYDAVVRAINLYIDGLHARLEAAGKIGAGN